jgi:hypothetical protein
VELEKRKGKVEDQDIIPWLADHDAVWIHADDNAKTEHRKLIITKKIRTLWVYRRGGMMSNREQLRVLSYVLPMVLDDFEKRPRHKHYRAFVLGEPPSTRPRHKEYKL